jgi:hypothetical protein
VTDIPRPENRCYGITHDLVGNPKIVEPKALKVGIGLPKGKAIHVYIDRESRWVIQIGGGRDAKRTRFEKDKRRDAQRFYYEQKRQAPERKYPERLEYFTFTHVGADGDHEPDWENIDSHGPLPTEINIVFLNEEPFSTNYQFYTTTALQCRGDGLVASRINTLAQTKEEKDLAKLAIERGEQYFPIVNGCWVNGCPYSKPTDNRPAPCRPMSRLVFQLKNDPRLGGAAVYNSAGYRSMRQIFSSIELIKAFTRGRIAGIPITMVLRPYKVVHDGKSTKQYGVSLEYRANSALELKQTLIEHSARYIAAGEEPLRQLESGPVHDIPAKVIVIPEDYPAAIAAEFEPADASDDPTDSDPADIEEYGDPAGGLEHAWDPEPGEQLPPPQEGAKVVAAAEAKTFYDLCRSKGMNDRTIFDKLGAMGIEKLEEITVKDLPELQLWASGYKPGQGSLI